MTILSTGLLLLHSALITNNISFNFVNNLYSHCIYSNCFANCIYVMGRKFAFYLRIIPAIYSHVTKVYGSLFLFSTGIQQHATTKCNLIKPLYRRVTHRAFAVQKSVCNYAGIRATIWM